MMSDLKDCTSCPITAGFDYEYDCGFPDCVGGWENAFKLQERTTNALRSELEAAKDELNELKNELTILKEG